MERTTTARPRHHRLALILPIAIVLTLVAAISPAEVERVEITSREVFADGMTFGETGAYEKIRGRLFYAVDPANPANEAIVDLDLAPRGSDGLVRFQGDFLLLKPIDLTRGNGRLLYDVNNRGNLYMLRHINGGNRTNDPATPEDAGNGYLMEQGYSLLWSATALTVHEAHDTMPVWSPDSSQIAFAADRYGNFDVYVIAASGGPATRLTMNSANDLPTSLTPDGGAVLFSSTRLDARSCVQFPRLL